MKGLAQIYASWIERFHVDGFRVDTAKHVNAAFFRLWVPRIRAAARAAGIAGLPDLRRGDAERRDRPLRLRPRPGRAAAARLPVPGRSPRPTRPAPPARRGSRSRLDDDDYFRLPDGADPAFATFLGNHDMGRAAQQILAQAPGLSRGRAAPARSLLGYDLLYLLRGAPVVMYGDEVGMIGTRRRQGRPAGHVPDPGRRVADGAAGRLDADRQRFVVRRHRQPDRGSAARRCRLCATRTRRSSTGASIVRYAKGPVLVVVADRRSRRARSW